MTLQQMIDAAGIDKMLEISLALGGRRVYISRSPAPEKGSAAHALGADLWAALQKDFAGDTVEIPSRSAVLHAQKLIRAGEMLEAGMSINMTARKTGLSKRTVRRIRMADLARFAGRGPHG